MENLGKIGKNGGIDHWSASSIAAIIFHFGFDASAYDEIDTQISESDGEIEIKDNEGKLHVVEVSND